MPSFLANPQVGNVTTILYPGAIDYNSYYFVGLPMFRQNIVMRKNILYNDLRRTFLL